MAPDARQAGDPLLIEILPQSQPRGLAKAVTPAQKNALAPYPGLRSFWNRENGVPYALHGFRRVALRDSVDSAFDFLDDIKAAFRMRDPRSEFQLRKLRHDELGYEHIRLRQFHEGIPVAGSELIVHINDGREIYLVNGHYTPDIDVSMIPSIGETQALQVGLNDFSGNLTVSVVQGPDLVIYPLGTHHYLAYRYALYCNEAGRVGLWIHYVDAHSGELLDRYNDIQFIESPTDNGDPVSMSGRKLMGEGGGNVVFPGWQDYTNMAYYLWNNDLWWYIRNDALEGQDADTYAHRTDSPDWGDSDRVEISAALNFHLTQRYFSLKHNRESFDDNGRYVQAYVHVRHANCPNNAWWDPQNVWFAFCDGDGVNYDPFPTLDIVAHEFSHGWTSSESDLTYWRESGALNESFSDIMGTNVEFYAQEDGRNYYPNAQPGMADWLCGEDARKSTIASRDMRNPSNTATVGEGRESPSRYHGRYWVSDAYDNGGVHFNSGVQNFFYYLISEGGAGTNDGIPYQVTGMGIKNARRVAYHVNTYYLTESDTFQTARWYWIVAAETLFLSTYPERVTAVKKAWDAVGVREVPQFDPFESFEEAALPAGFSTGGNATWFITADDKTHGNQSMRAGGIGENQSSWLQWQISLSEASPISFFVRISCQWNVASNAAGDGLKFYVDGVERATWRGDFPWAFYSDLLPAGSHTLRWEYSKDDYVSLGLEDTAWIDEIYLPEVFVLTSFAINNGASSTDSRLVTLNHGVTGSPTHCKASESPAFTGISWRSYVSVPQLILSPGDGTKTVYFKARKADGEVTPVMSDSIVYTEATTPLTVDGPPVEGNLEFNNDSDWFQFSAPLAGVYMIETRSGTLIDSTMYLYGPDSQENLIATDDNSGVGNMAKIVRHLNPGTYYVMLEGVGIGTYQISVKTPSSVAIDDAPSMGQINPAGDEGFYQFTVADQTPLVIDTAAGTLTNVTLTLYGPEDVTLIVADDDGGIGNMARITRILPAGTYYLKIRGKPPAATGTYFIGVATIPELVMDGPDTSGTLASPDDYNYYRFYVSSQGTYIIETWAGTLNNTLMNLYGPDSMTKGMGTDEDSGIGKMAKIVKFLTPGTYYVKIKGDATGTYTIRVKTPLSLAINGSNTPGEINPGEEEDWYQFTVSSPNLYRIATASGETSPITGDILSLYGPNGLTLISSDFESGGGELATLTLYLAAGTYDARVRALIQGATGTYTISVLPFASEVSPDGPPVAGIMEEWMGEDWYVFTAPSRNVYIIDTLEGTLADTKLYLYGPNGLSLITSDDNSGIGNMAKIVRCLNPGSYLVKLKAKPLGTTGTYSLRIITPASLLVNDPMTSGLISPAGDEDWYSFTISPGGSHVLGAVPVTLPTLLLSLYGPDSLTLISTDSSTGPDDMAAIAKRLAAGTYFIKIKDGSRGASGMGNYEVGVRSGGGWLTVSPSDLDFGTDLKEAPFTVANKGTGPLNWTLKDDLPAWLSANPIQGTLQAGGSKAVTLKVDRGELSPGAYAHTLLIASDGGNTTVGVTMDVGGAVSGWAKTYGGPSDDGYEEARDIRGTDDGGYIVAGSTSSFGAGNRDYWVMKLNSVGTIEWEKTYGGAAQDDAFAVVKTVDGGYLVAGESYSFRTGTTGRDIWILKLFSDGTADWEKNYGGTGTEHVESVITTLDADGAPDGYLVVGSTYSFSTGGADLWLLKLRTDGTIAWERAYGGDNNEFGRAAQQTSDRGFIVVGDTQSFGAGNRDVWALRINPGGEIVWQKAFGGSDYDQPVAVQLDDEGGYVIGAFTRSFNGESRGYDFWVFKVNDSGEAEWQKTYGTTSGEYMEKLEKTEGGGYVVVGRTEDPVQGYNIWVLKLSGTGGIDWQKMYNLQTEGISETEWGYAIQQTVDGGYAVAGTTNWITKNGDFWVLKLAGDGSLGCDIETATEGIAAETTLTSTTTEAAMTVSEAAAPDTGCSVGNTSAVIGTPCGQASYANALQDNEQIDHRPGGQ
jgi:Zn-dependent metalloprotease